MFSVAVLLRVANSDTTVYDTVKITRDQFVKKSGVQPGDNNTH